MIHKKELESKLQNQMLEYEKKLSDQKEQHDLEIEELKHKYEELLITKEKELFEQQNKINNLQKENFNLHIKSCNQTLKGPNNKEVNIFDENDISNFEKVEELGSGGEGKVFKVFMRQYYALKEMNIKENNFKSFRNILSEYEIMNFLQHPNILKTYGIFMSNEEKPPCILLEYCPNNLDKAIKNRSLSNEEIVLAIYQIAEGMKFIHFNKIIHRDLKPTNILIAIDGTIKICDFGISRIMSPEMTMMTQNVGTLNFMAPEIINGDEHYDEKVDVYSFGVVVFFILNNGKMPNIKIGDIFKGKKAPIPSSFTEFAKELINDCWNLDAKDRPSFESIIDKMANNHYNLLPLSEYELKKVEDLVNLNKNKIKSYDK